MDSAADSAAKAAGPKIVGAGGGAECSSPGEHLSKNLALLSDFL